MSSRRFWAGVFGGFGLALVAIAPLAMAAPIGASGSGAPARNAADIARDHLREHRKELGLKGSDLREIVVDSTVVSRHNGLTHVYFQQRYQGIGVYNGIIGVHVAADGRVIGTANRFVGNLAAAVSGQSDSINAAQAMAVAARALDLTPTSSFATTSFESTPDRATTLSDGGVADGPIAARLVWARTDAGVRLAWNLRFDEAGGDHWWIALVDAGNGKSLGQQDLVIEDSAESLVMAVARTTERVAEAPSFAPTDGAEYRVFPLPFESPSDGAREFVTDVADPDASPFGWHDTNGAPGAEFTVTRGNNVHAYTDIDANNVADPGSDPDGGAGLSFDFPLDLSQNPDTYRPAVVTNLFYWNNIVHDVTHGYGFDESAGNFQVNNYGHGGLGNDDVRAEAQDGSGTNNANFGTPADGARPRMQMFVWTSPRPNFVTVTSPAGIAGDYGASGAAFGPSLITTGPISGSVVLVNDGAGASTSDGCEALVGFPAGAIALLDRGSCTFVIKVKNAQVAGASSVIVANNVAGTITMGGADPTITIPSVMVTLDDGDLFKANLPVTATLRANPATSINRDSDLDAGVIAHEYGHGISNRLTGGPGTASCLGNAEQMGEGWSDWFAMVLTTDPADTGTSARGVGSYVSFQPADGPGIRPTPYTTDMSVNPSTYAFVADVANITQPHGIGYVWNSMLWEVYWNLVDAHGYNADVYGDWNTGGNNLAIQLVMDGFKLQPCLPGFVDGRNAILLADQALTGGANQCEIWRGFAKRGLGASASQGLSTSRTDGVEAFNLPVACTTAVFGGFKPPVSNAPLINNANAGSTIPVKFTLSGATNPLVIDSQEVDCVTLVPTGAVPVPPQMPGSTGIKQKGNEYQFNWKTDSAWSGTCRRLTLRIPAASDAVAYFSFF